MYYVVDVITLFDREDYRQSWGSFANRLQQCPGFWRAELFEKDQDIRSAYYDFLVVYSFEDSLAYEWALAHKLLPTSVQNQKVERFTGQLEIQLEDLQESKPGHTWLINPFEISEAQIPDVLDMWDKAKDVMVSKPGFISARLFRTDSAEGRFGLVNVAHWASAGEFLAVLDSRAYDSHREKSMNYKLHPSLCTQVDVVYKQDLPLVANG